MIRLLIKLSIFTVLAILVNNCCSIVIPPVTLTGNKTAIEKQIIGEQNELEKNVWMVSSAKTTNRAKLDVEDDNKEEKNEHLDDTLVYSAFALLEEFNPRLANLKADRVVGENRKGLVSNLFNESTVKISSPSKRKYNAKYADDIDKGEAYRILIETVKQVNRARTMLVKSYIVNQKKVNKKFKADIDELILQQKSKYHDSTLAGEYIQADSGKWKLKK